MPAKHNQDALDEEEVDAIKDQLTFSEEELNTVWTKNKPGNEESSDDKIDRISKIVATLRSTLFCHSENVKLITDK